jgi:hypothetical protein
VTNRTRPAAGALACGLAVLLLTGPLAAQGPERVDPGLRFLWMNRSLLSEAPPAPRPGPPAPRADRRARPAGLFEPALDRTAGPVRVRLLVRVGPGGESALRAAGAEIGTRAGDIVTARVPLDALPRLFTEPSLRRLELASTLGPLAAPPSPGSPAAASDLANRDAGFDGLRRRAGERWRGLAGAGVVVGVFDSGLDLTHEDFLHPDGRTRVLFAWDQTTAGRAPGAVGGHAFEYGTECAAPTIEAGECPMRDVVGHGTHVTGVAAGDGSATGAGQPAWRFPGGAPAADLVVVKGGNSTFTADRLVDGVAYIFARADALGRPAVVNLSIASQQGPHDGTTLLEEALDALTGPGRIIVAGSGNAGDHRNTFPLAINGPNHAEGRRGSGSHAVIVPPYQPSPGPVTDGLLLELWYDGRDSLAITVRTPAGRTTTVATGDSATLETPGGAVSIVNAVDGPAPGNGDHAALIGIADLEVSAPPDTGRWAIEVSPVAVNAGGDYHLWLVGHTLITAVVPRLDGGTTNRYLVGAPASADRIIAAGAHVTRHEWLGVGDETATFPLQEQLGDIAYFSSPGPRRDGVQKPDVTAPGKVLMAALSENATLWDGVPWLVEADSVHVGLLGTSTSSPQVTAAVALLLQLEAGLEPEEARDALRATAATDAFVARSLPDPTWGSGKLDIAAAVRRVRPDGLPDAAEAVAFSENPIRSDGLVISYRERPRSVAVYTLVGERVRSFNETEIGPLVTVWSLDTDEGGQVANGAYVLVIELPDQRLIRKLLVAR